MDAENTERTLNDLEEEIHTLQSSRSMLLLQLRSIDLSLAQLQAKYATAKNRMASIGSIPNEILAKIFRSGRDSNIPGEKRFEILASHITTVWREVAITTPSLWNILEIEPNRSSQMLAAYLTRAKACNLQVRFNFLQEVWVPDQSVWDLILPSVERWHSLEISVYDEAALYTTIAHLEPLRASLLEEIIISRPRSSDVHPPIAYTHGLGFRNSGLFFHAGAPRLHKLHLEYYLSSWPPLVHLTTLYLHNLPRSMRPSWNRFRDLLVSSSQLSHLSIHGDVVSGKPPPNVDIQIPSLRCLRIRGTDTLGSRASDLLLAISMPHLTSLTLYNMVYTDLDPWLSGFQLLHSLTSLTLYWPAFTAATYSKLGETMPHVIHLTLIDRQPEELLTFLGHPISGSFDFSWSGMTDFALYPGDLGHGDIGAMIRNRSTSAPLQQLRLGTVAPLPGVRVLAFDPPPPWPAWAEELT
ncbi:hypothetical protein MSAN_01258400 [Mycena sanguinolenta]|uniref:F-box domain-containing protein n=1 Tax=Mycena sanguinolenta TaxID=230812 RepID=A0A8H6YIG2_9AGAR|nr:hypothetical protein MSAN_01258400 [Mycena sanguinolenta]